MSRPLLTFQSATLDIVTVKIGGQIFGIPVQYVQDVLMPHRITVVPLAPKRVAGVMNLRGRIVTAIATRVCLGLDGCADVGMFVVVTVADELYGLMVDEVGDAVTLETSAVQPTPAHIDPDWRHISAGIVHRQNDLVIILNVCRLIGGPGESVAA